MPHQARDDDADPGQAWMVAFKRGDEAAFTSLVRHYGARVIAFFRRGGADASAAEDLAQEAFLRIARARERYEPTAKFTTWLHRILFRIALNDAVRNRWRRSVSFAEERGGAPELLAADESAPARELARSESRAGRRTCVRWPGPRRPSEARRSRQAGTKHLRNCIGASLRRLRPDRSPCALGRVGLR